MGKMAELKKNPFEIILTDEEQRQYLPPWANRLYYQSKKNAAKRKIPFELSQADMTRIVYGAGSRCQVSGVEFDFSRSNGKRRPFYPSLDRRDSSKGYSLKNCRLVCTIVNIAMNEWGPMPLHHLMVAMATRSAAKVRFCEMREKEEKRENDSSKA
jgi:hypothetical protein